MFEHVESFHRPGSLREALQLLQSNKGRAQIVAGLPDMTVGDGPPIRRLIDISHAGLAYVRRRGANWAIGASTKLAAIEESSEMQALAGGILAVTSSACGPAQIRNRATIANVAQGSRAADLLTPLSAFDAFAVVAGRFTGGTAAGPGRRKLPLADFLAAAHSHDLKDALLVEVGFPEPPGGAHCGWSFQKFGRTALDVSTVNVAAGLGFDGHRRVQWARIAVGAVAPAPVRMREVEAAMAGHALNHGLLAEACESVMREVHPTSDLRASAEYRRELCRILTGRALEECAARAGCSL